MFGPSDPDTNDLGFTTSEIHSLIEQGVRTSWLPEERQTELLGRIRAAIEAIDGGDA